MKAAPFKIKTIQTDLKMQNSHNGIELTCQFVSDPKCIDKSPKEHPLDILCAKHNIYHKLIPLVNGS
jgi:hypothetical protein